MHSVHSEDTHIHSHKVGILSTAEKSLMPYKHIYYKIDRCK